MNIRLKLSLLTCLGLLATSTVFAADEAVDVSLSENRIHLKAPAAWKKQQPRSRILDYEFALPAVEGDQNDGRLTIMGAGGSVKANIDRWVGQFSQPDGTATKDRARVDKSTIDGQEVHLVDISGDFKDKPRGPFGPSVDRPGYRMLGAIISTKKVGQYFVKAYGPAKTMAANEKAFKDMIESLKVKE